MTKYITYSYAVFGALLVSSIIPNMTLQNISAIMSLLFIIILYVLRSKTDQESVERVGFSYLIKTFWVWSALYILGLIVAGIIISTTGDMTALDEWAQSVIDGATATEEDVNKLIESYLDTNFYLITISVILGCLPATLYAGKRLFDGWSGLKN